MSGECRRRAERSVAGGYASYLAGLSFEERGPVDVPGLTEPLESAKVLYE